MNLKYLKKTESFNGRQKASLKGLKDHQKKLLGREQEAKLIAVRLGSPMD